MEHGPFIAGVYSDLATGVTCMQTRLKNARLCRRSAQPYTEDRDRIAIPIMHMSDLHPTMQPFRKIRMVDEFKGAWAMNRIPAAVIVRCFCAGAA